MTDKRIAKQVKLGRIVGAYAEGAARTPAAMRKLNAEIDAAKRRRARRKMASLAEWIRAGQKRAA